MTKARLLAALAVLPGPALAAGASSASQTAHVAERCPHTHWVAAWSTSPSDAQTDLDDQSIRMILTPHIGGRRIRVHLSNRFGMEPLRVTDVRVARSDAGPAISGPDPQASFGGHGSIEIAPGDDAVSDPLHLDVHAMKPLAVTATLPGPTGPLTRHVTAEQTSYVSAPGSPVAGADRAGTAFTQAVPSWLAVSGLDVSTSRRRGAIVALGDSLTEGLRSSDGANRRYPDYLARRLLARDGRASPSVLNAGISGNGLIFQANQAYGPPVRLRMRADAVGQPGATDAILMAGGNDLGLFSAGDVIHYTHRVVDRLERAGMHVIVGTIPPRGSGAQAALGRINHWIRRQPLAAVAEFARAVRDPENPNALNPAYDSGDGLHLNDAGYRAMAGAVPLAKLDGRTCARAG
jgi:lysophospholipase L1-like esterase